NATYSNVRPTTSYARETSVRGTEPKPNGEEPAKPAEREEPYGKEPAKPAEREEPYGEESEYTPEEKRKKVRELYRQGLSPELIASNLDSTVGEIEFMITLMEERNR
ncbi:MAG: hypothetical protein ACLFNZ_12110, partial [Spirochaetaceae bacterium]